MAPRARLLSLPTLAEVIERPSLAATLPLDSAQRLFAQATANLAGAQAARDALLVRVATASGGPELSNRPELEPLVDAKEMARLLDVHESWVRIEQRAGRIPFVQIGRYIRFCPSQVLSVFPK